MDQLTSPDSYLLTWKEIQNSRFLVQKQNYTMVIDVRTRLRLKYPPNELIHIWNNKDKQIIFCKTAIAQDSYSTTSITNGEHYIPFYYRRHLKTPHPEYKLLILVKCQGCHFNSYYMRNTNETSYFTLFKVRTKNKTLTFNSTRDMPKPFYNATETLHYLKQKFI
ncbi:unnamed protein product [Rhizophagus irregularis]|nr:unnamed protein product [Rhizophagus irregularis]